MTGWNRSFGTMNNKFLSLLGIARKAGKLGLGHDAAKGAIVSGKARLCILSNDVSERLKKEFEGLTCSEASGVPVIITDCTMFELGHAVGSKAGVITVNDEGFAEKLKRLSEDGNE